MENRTYDERYYLNESNIYEREFLLNEQRFWNIREVYDGILYSSLIKDYEAYIKVVSKLVNEITPNIDELSKISTIMYLIRDGVVSHTGGFIDKSPCIDIIRTKPSINVLEGSGCCRHFAGVINDIIPTSTVLSCVCETDNPFNSEANHVINKINYNGNIYGFDAFNGCLFDFRSEFEMIEVIDKEQMHLYYKPYAEIMFYKRSFESVKEFLEQIKKNGTNKISSSEVNEIFLESALNIACYKELIKDFESDTRNQMKGIKEQIKEIRIKQ